ncbi:hypothetical protein V8C86DRAFT_2853651, partial [Haematococcus lacustris]
VSHEDLPLWGGGHYTVTGGPSNRPTASRPLYCATSLGTFAYLCARTARVLGMITVLLLGCAAWAAALAASIGTTLDATRPATTAETSAGTAAGEQPVTADGIQPAAAMAHLGLKMKGGQHLKASKPPSAQEQPRPAKKRAGRVGQRVAGWGQRAPGAAELDMPDMHAFDDQPQPQQKPGPSWVKWAIHKERSDAAARQNETQRQFDYVASAPAHEQLLTSKRAALQAAMQEQLDLAWEQHAAWHAASWRQHAACSKLGPSPLQQMERHEDRVHRCSSLLFANSLDWLQGV